MIRTDIWKIWKTRKNEHTFVVDHVREGSIVAEVTVSAFTPSSV
jgi:hypothetical protein